MPPKRYTTTYRIEITEVKTPRKESDGPAVERKITMQEVNGSSLPAIHAAILGQTL